MATAFVSHHVKDYDVWKPIFEKDEEVRAAMGMKLLNMFRGQEDPNEISFLFDISDLEAMRKMMDSEEMKMKMKEAGVDGEISIKIMDKVM